MLKFKFIVILVLGVFFSSCEKNNDEVLNKSNKSKIEKESSTYNKSVKQIDYVNYSNKILAFFDESETKVYVVEIYGGVPDLPENPVSIGLTSESLTITEFDESEIVYSLNDEFVEGIGWHNLASALEANMVLMSDGEYSLNDDENHDPALKCACFNTQRVGQEVPNNCTSGGNSPGGSCSVTDSSGAKCERSCPSSSTPCCTLDSGFTYD